MSPRRIRIAGIGNTLAGDDALGIRAIERIREEVWKGVETVALSMPGPELFDGLHSDDLLILIDACESGATAGTVHSFGSDEISLFGLRHLSTHGLGLADWILLAKAAGEAIPDIRIYGIELQHCRMGEPLSTAVAVAMPDLLQRVRSCVDTCLSTDTCHA
jgi:hydrogenase maturation protease